MAFSRSMTKRPRRVPREFIVAGFSMALFASICVIFVLCIQVRVYSSELDRIKQTDLSRVRELEEMKNKMISMEAEVIELVESRLPHLNELSYDEVIAIEGQYIKNIVFTVTGKNSQKLYEYKAVFENSGSAVIEPKASLTFFDRLGIQIGRSNIGSDLSEDNGNRLERGEVRSYYNNIQFPVSSIPRYFMISMASPDLLPE